ncbi:NADPH-dependent 2,4-dienoyl-CoA reductase/sulfur reductase-like enzyme [Prauserella isguenensis]|uniref:NADPH-dependent 2,4-dienoyl-CoA reductase/sulfur reductase-like enzyme n=1 Tax=Prauserella isguenensis TaxID=1470180 RepID=A0A839S2C2_9PSEU|nr:FAD-dependent oxidoreductase [Prauserella isguenensis]MBB3051542.1 NADPH-dependent 2,4-dienoyl-CoA reductase/sulfur reductase-like enzyme [Prauserella isguenensis]
MERVTVVGASLAGLATVRALRAQEFEGRITLIGDERHEPYDRPPLSKEYLAGTVSEDDIGLTHSDDAELDVEWVIGQPASSLDTAGKSVELAGGFRIETDAVVVATGARARELPGDCPEGVHTLRTLDDARALRTELVPGARLVVIGAGFIGAEIASTAAGLGCEVDIVEAADVPLQRPLGAEMGAVCGRLHARNGARLHAGTGLAELVGETRVKAVRLTDGRELPADVVVVGIGAQPNTEWLAGSGLDLDGGVRTDEQGRTAVPEVLAVGDCAHSYRDYTAGWLRLEHWTNALQQPAAAVAALLGREHSAPAHHSVPYFWSDQYGHKIQFAGHRTADCTVQIEEGDPDSGDFLALYLDSEERPVGVLAIDRARPFGQWRRKLARSR